MLLKCASSKGKGLRHKHVFQTKSNKQALLGCLLMTHLDIMKNFNGARVLPRRLQDQVAVDLQDPVERCDLECEAVGCHLVQVSTLGHVAQEPVHLL